MKEFIKGILVGMIIFACIMSMSNSLILIKLKDQMTRHSEWHIRQEVTHILSDVKSGNSVSPTPKGYDSLNYGR